MPRRKPTSQPVPPHVRITLLAITILVAFFWAWLAGTIFHAIDARKAATIPPESQSVMPTPSDAEQSASLPIVDVPKPDANILIVGDIMLGRYVETLIKKNGEDYPFAKLDSLLNGHDLVAGNLEGPIVRDHRQTADDSLVFSFPVSTAALLARHKFTHLSIANNHGLDQGTGGVIETQEALRQAGVTPFGHPSSVQNEDVVITTVNGHGVVLIGFQAVSSSFPSEQARELITTLRSDHPAAFIIVIPHWGNEYQTTSSKHQQTLAHDWIDAGADAVIGHHPHVVQESEIYNGRMIVYSLGNFIFDQYFSAETQRGLAVEIVLNAETVSYTLVPLASERSQPQPMTENESLTWLTDYQKHSPTVTFEGDRVTLPRSLQ
ncbi:MAG: CapA family protein [Candidatus Kerfeldbacteria bacterium]|nr:CapA family protein [Candidatus Kerfeldbacteria bacterium]